MRADGGTQSLHRHPPRHKVVRERIPSTAQRMTQTRRWGDGVSRVLCGRKVLDGLALDLCLDTSTKLQGNVEYKVEGGGGGDAKIPLLQLVIVCRNNVKCVLVGFCRSVIPSPHVIVRVKGHLGGDSQMLLYYTW